MELKFLREALYNGMTANAFKLGTVLTGGWFWMRIGGCSVLYRGPGMSEINFDDLLAVSANSATTAFTEVILPFLAKGFKRIYYSRMKLKFAKHIT